MIIVFGSINTDIVVQVPHHVRPGETLIGSDAREGAGGKGANQALAARRMGGTVAMVGAVGADGFAETALKHLKADGIDLSGVETRDVATGLAFISVDPSGENAIVLAPGANATVRALQLTDRLSHGVILITQNEVPWAETQDAHRAATLAGATVIHNAAPAHVIGADALGFIDYLVVNEIEAADVASGLGLEAADPMAAARAVADAGSVKVIVTLGPEGAVLFDGEDAIRASAPIVEVVDTTGAGDTFVGTFAAALSRGQDQKTALENAVKMGSLACTQAGAQDAIPRFPNL